MFINKSKLKTRRFYEFSKKGFQTNFDIFVTFIDGDWTNSENFKSHPPMITNEYLFYNYGNKIVKPFYMFRLGLIDKEFKIK